MQEDKRDGAVVAEEQQPKQSHEYMSQNMVNLKICLEMDDDRKFEEIMKKDLYDTEEVFMYLFCAVSCFNSEKIFDILLKRNNYFKVNKEWNLLFSTNRVFY